MSQTRGSGERPDGHLVPPSWLEANGLDLDELRARFLAAVERGGPPRILPPPSRDLSTVLWRRGRFWLVFEPRDLWFGVFVSPRAVFVCLVPCVAVKWERR